MMMNDTALDELLMQWKTERAPQPETFASVDHFEASFLAKYRIEKRKQERTLRGAVEELKKRFLRPGAANAAMALPSCCHAQIPVMSAASRLFSPSLKACSMSAAAGVGNQLSMNMSFSADDAAPPAFDTEEYKTVGERPFVEAATNPRSTFGADVDTAMYANVRRMVFDEDRLPPPEAVRIEELLNYFSYDYPQPGGEAVMRPCFEWEAAPWSPERRLLLIGVQAKVPARETLPPSHYVFLIDNSGSMSWVFPMVKKAMTALARQLRPGDRVSMVTYGGEVKVQLEGCPDIDRVCKKIAGLRAAGCTPGGKGIQKAYRLAEEHFIDGGNNRIVLITDGDFNVGVSSEAELVEMVKAKRDTGIYLSIAGCGMGNYKDNKLKMLANKGNGNVFYLDNEREAKRVFVHGMTGNMYALARDVKFQIEFNPERVFAYRLIGYELRDMTDRDFRDDRKESGTVGLGQQVTALYEIIPANAPDEVKNSAIPGAQPLKYVTSATTGSDELLTFRIRWKKPQGRGAAREDSEAVKSPLPATANWGWAAAVAEFGLALRKSEYAPGAAIEHAAREAQKYLGEDRSGERAEFLLLLRRAAELRRE
jgi:Ca-activated chloride channel family protein